MMTHIVKPKWKIGIKNVPVYRLTVDDTLVPDETWPHISSCVSKPYLRVRPYHGKVAVEARKTHVAKIRDIIPGHAFYDFGWIMPTGLVGRLIDWDMLKKQAELIPEDKFFATDKEFRWRLSEMLKAKRSQRYRS